MGQQSYLGCLLLFCCADLYPTCSTQGFLSLNYLLSCHRWVHYHWCHFNQSHPLLLSFLTFNFFQQLWESLWELPLHCKFRVLDLFSPTSVLSYIISWFIDWLVWVSLRVRHSRALHHTRYKFWKLWGFRIRCLVEQLKPEAQREAFSGSGQQPNWVRLLRAGRNEPDPGRGVRDVSAASIMAWPKDVWMSLVFLFPSMHTASAWLKVTSDNHQTLVIYLFMWCCGRAGLCMRHRLFI